MDWESKGKVPFLPGGPFSSMAYMPHHPSPVMPDLNPDFPLNEWSDLGNIAAFLDFKHKLEKIVPVHDSVVNTDILHGLCLVSGLTCIQQSLKLQAVPQRAGK